MTMYFKWYRDDAEIEPKEVFFTEAEALVNANKENYLLSHNDECLTYISTIEQANEVLNDHLQYAPFTLVKTGAEYTLSFKNLLGFNGTYKFNGTYGVEQLLRMFKVKNYEFVTYMLLSTINTDNADEPCKVSSTVNSMTSKELENRLDRCENNCKKYYSCDIVAEMNNKLVKEEEQAEKEVNWEYRVACINISNCSDTEPFNDISAYNITTDMVDKAADFGSVYTVEEFFKRMNLCEINNIDNSYCIYYKVDTNNPNNIVILNEVN